MPLFTSPAARKLPRPLLYALLLLYALPGLFGRDPWKTDDAVGFGLMLTMARGDAGDWLMPNVLGIPLPAEGPLFFWLGGVCIKLFGALIGELLASRVAIFAAIYLLCWAVWYATFALARRPEAQPPDPIGGAAPPATAYGRVVADSAMLILLATLGLAGRLHETTAEVGAIAFVALGLYGLASALRRPRKGAILFAIALAGCLLTRGISVAVPLLLASLIAFAWCKPLRFNLKPFGLWCIAIALPLMAAWPGLLWWEGTQGQAYLHDWWQWNLNQFGFAWNSLRITGRTLLWFCWPAWPIALWALWYQRNESAASWRTPQIALPLTFLVCFLLLTFGVKEASHSYLMPVLPGLVVLAAIGLTRMQRGGINAIDWFAVMVFSTLCVAAWFYWIASMTGTPVRIAHQVARLAPGFKPVLIWFELFVAIALTIAWIWLISWRIGRRPKVLWRSVVLSCGGLVLTWALLMTLWLPWLNHTRTYRDVAQQLRLKLPADYRCLEARYLGLAQRTTLAYFAGVNFAAPGTEGRAACDFLLLQDSVLNLRDARLPDPTWVLHWEGRRAADRDERFRLYRKRVPDNN